MVSSLVSAPLNIGYWGVDTYGVYVTIVSVVSFFSISNLGLGTAISIIGAQNSNVKDKIDVIKKGWRIGVIITFITLFIYLFFYNSHQDFFLKYLPIDFNQNHIYIKVFFVLASAAILNALFLNLIGSFHAIQKMYIDNYFSMAINLVNLISILITILIKGDLLSYVIISSTLVIAFRFIELILLLIFIKKLNVSDEKVCEKVTTNKQLISTGFNVLFYGLSMLIISNIDNLVIAHYSKSSDVAAYSMSFRLFYLAFGMIVAFNASLAPIISKEFGIENYLWIKKIYKRMSIIAMYLASLIWVCSYLLGEEIINVWLGSDVYPGKSVFFFMGMFGFFYCLANVHTVVLNSINYTKLMPFIGWSEMIINLVLSIVLIKFIGLSGVIIATIIASSLIPNLLMPWYIKRRSKGILFSPSNIILKFSIYIIIPIMSLSVFVVYLFDNYFIKILCAISIAITLSISAYSFLDITDKKLIKFKLFKS